MTGEVATETGEVATETVEGATPGKLARHDSANATKPPRWGASTHCD